MTAATRGARGAARFRPPYAGRGAVPRRRPAAPAARHARRVTLRDGEESA